MPIMGYKVETAALSDKVMSNRSDCTHHQFSPSLPPSQAVHPYFGRVSFSAGARFEAEAAFLRSHYWDKVVGLQHVCTVSTVHGGNHMWLLM